MKKFVSYIGFIIIIILLIVPSYHYIKKKIYFNNNIVVTIPLSNFNIIDTYTEDNINYITLTLEDEILLEKYQIKDNVRIYKTLSSDVYNEINTTIDYPGIILEAIVDTKSISKNEAMLIRTDPFFILSKQKYSKWITISRTSK